MEDEFVKITSVDDLVQKMGASTQDKEINKKKGEIFEKYCQWLFNKRLDNNLYKIENVGDTSDNRIYTQAQQGDGGVDLNITNIKNNKNIPIQCKYNASNNSEFNYINENAIRCFHSVMMEHRIETGIFIATTKFSKNALIKVNDFWYKSPQYRKDNEPRLKIFCIDKKCLDELIAGTFDLSFIDEPNNGNHKIHPAKWYTIKLKQQQ